MNIDDLSTLQQYVQDGNRFTVDHLFMTYNNDNIKFIAQHLNVRTLQPDQRERLMNYILPEYETVRSELERLDLLHFFTIQVKLLTKKDIKLRHVLRILDMEHRRIGVDFLLEYNVVPKDRILTYSIRFSNPINITFLKYLLSTYSPRKSFYDLVQQVFHKALNSYYNTEDLQNFLNIINELILFPNSYIDLQKVPQNLRSYISQTINEWLDTLKTRDYRRQLKEFIQKNKTFLMQHHIGLFRVVSAINVMDKIFGEQRLGQLPIELTEYISTFYMTIN